MKKRVSVMFLSMLFALLLLAGPSTAVQNVLIVNQNDNTCSDLGVASSFCKIQAAIDYAADNAFPETNITVRNGNYDGFVVYKDNVTIKAVQKNVFINGHEIIVPIADQSDAAVYVVVGASNVRIQGFTINGRGSEGKGIDVGILLEGGNTVTLAVGGTTTTRTTKKPVRGAFIGGNTITGMEPVCKTPDNSCGGDRGYGIFVSGYGFGDAGSFIISNNTLTGNNRGIGILGDVGTSLFRYNRVYGNKFNALAHGFGFYWPQGNFINARNNWWGDASGPGAIPNPWNTSEKVIDAINKTTEADGDGNPIFCCDCGVEGENKGGVAFDPWCQDENCISVLIVNQNDSTCSDWGDTSSFCTIQGAIDYAAYSNFPETTISVKNGSYDGFVVYHDNMTVESEIKHGAVINGNCVILPINNAPDARTAIVVGASNVAIKGFLINGTGFEQGIILDGDKTVTLADQTTRTTHKPVLNSFIAQNKITGKENAIFVSGYGCPQGTWGDAAFFIARGNILTGNSCAIGLLGDVGTSEFTYNQIYDNNNSICFHYAQGNYIDARNNWWGDPSGPSSILNPNNLNKKVIDAINKTTEADGAGDNIYCWGCGVEGENKGGVAFDPWCQDENCISEFINDNSSGCLPYKDGQHHMKYSVEFTENRLIIDMKIYYYDSDSPCDPDAESQQNLIYEWDYAPFIIPWSGLGIRLYNPKVTMHISGENASGLTWWYNFIAFCGKSNWKPPAWVPNTDIDITGLDCRCVYNVPQSVQDGSFPGFIHQPRSEDVLYVGFEFFNNPLNQADDLKIYTLQELIEALGLKTSDWN
jgi:hypothetical protein